MEYYTIKSGSKCEIQVFDGNDEIIDIFEMITDKDKTFNETWFLGGWECDCCDDKLMSFYMGSFFENGREIRECLIVSEDCVVTETDLSTQTPVSFGIVSVTV